MHMIYESDAAVRAATGFGIGPGAFRCPLLAWRRIRI